MRAIDPGTRKRYRASLVDEVASKEGLVQSLDRAGRCDTRFADKALACGGDEEAATRGQADNRAFRLARW